MGVVPSCEYSALLKRKCRGTAEINRGTSGGGWVDERERVFSRDRGGGWGAHRRERFRKLDTARVPSWIEASRVQCPCGNCCVHTGRELESKGARLTAAKSHLRRASAHASSRAAPWLLGQTPLCQLYTLLLPDPTRSASLAVPKWRLTDNHRQLFGVGLSLLF